MRRPLGARGQSMVEYLLSTLAVLALFSSMYGFTSNELRSLFSSAARVILTSYHYF